LSPLCGTGLSQLNGAQPRPLERVDAFLGEPALSVRACRDGYGSHSHAHAHALVGIHGSLQREVKSHPAFVDPLCGLFIPASAWHAHTANAPAQVAVVNCDAAP
jgi:hypothetical protein